MIVRRKFNLGRIGHKYESIEIEIEAATIEEAILKIEDAWRAYCTAVVNEVVQ